MVAGAGVWVRLTHVDREVRVACCRLVSGVHCCEVALLPLRPPFGILLLVVVVVAHWVTYLLIFHLYGFICK